MVSIFNQSLTTVGIYWSSSSRQLLIPSPGRWSPSSVVTVVPCVLLKQFLPFTCIHPWLLFWLIKAGHQTKSDQELEFFKFSSLKFTFTFQYIWVEAWNFQVHLYQLYPLLVPLIRAGNPMQVKSSFDIDIFFGVQNPDLASRAVTFLFHYDYEYNIGSRYRSCIKQSRR